jgi:hypothetical protein
MGRHLHDFVMHGFDPQARSSPFGSRGWLPDVTGHKWRLARGQRLFLEGGFRLKKHVAKCLAPHPFSNLMSLNQHLAQVRPEISTKFREPRFRKTTALVVCRRAVAIPHGFQRYGSPAHLRVNLASEACSGNHSPCLGVYVFVHFKAP